MALAYKKQKVKKHKELPDGIIQLDLLSILTDVNANQEILHHPSHEQPGRTEQLSFDTLAELPASDVTNIPIPEPIAERTGDNSEPLPANVIQSDTGGNELPDSMGDSKQGDVASRRRIILDDSEPESRDFRITEAHNVGTGSIHAKGKANIAVIRLLKEIEAEKREATEEEKEILVKYSGWGALPKVFDDINSRYDPYYKALRADLLEILNNDEYKNAAASTPNAHFTSPLVINSMWQAVKRFGFEEGEVLEPAVGTGNFLGLMPMKGNRTGIELDSITARITQTLYPDSKIFHKGFEETKLPDNFFDLAISNVPFGDYSVHDPDMKRGLTKSVHDYFFAKTLDKVRPGGIIAFITSRYTMDKKDSVIRQHLEEGSDFIGAIRLPNTAFKGNAGTEVTTDIIFLQKRAKGQQPNGKKWLETELIRIDGYENWINEYYCQHPEMMLGELHMKNGLYKFEPTLEGEITQEILAKAIEALPANIYTPRDKGRSPPVTILAPAESFTGVKDGAYAEVDGKIVIRNGGNFESTSLSGVNAVRILGMMEIRDQIHEVFRTQLEDCVDEEIIYARNELNRIYDRFVSKHGYITSKENFKLFTGDPDHPLILSLEKYSKEKNIAEKTAIFTQRTIQKAKAVTHTETAAEALAISLNETGGINWDRITSLTGQSLKQSQMELEGQVYKNPEGDWETADEYLSGDVRGKLSAAKEAAELNPIYMRNVTALEGVQPADILPGQISARLGSPWIPREDIRDFVVELLDVHMWNVTVNHSGTIASWTLKLDSQASSSVANTTTYATKRAGAESLIDDALNLRTPTIYDVLPDDTRIVNQNETIAAREMQQKIKDKFKEWIWKDHERAERLARLYNDTFNNIRLREYDGSHLTLSGINRTGLRNEDLDPHQKNAVWRILQNKNTLIGHTMGAGKTLSITVACMELKRLGLASKPMIVVPNHLVEQWGAAFLQAYPHANVFIAGKEHFTKGNREKAMARIATGNYDAVIVSHRSFESLPVSDETFKRFVDKEIDALEDAMIEAKAQKGQSRSIVKHLEKAKKCLETKILDRAKREKKDDGVDFEHLGIDRIFVDEADLMKNLGFASKMNRIAGLSNTESNRALDMYIKTQYMQEINGGTIFATGTPISNTMAEMYTLMRYLAPEILENAGVAHFDAWAANFGEAVTALEISPDGSGYRMHTRFAKFVNLPELLSMFRTFADIQTAEMLNLPRPALEGGKPQIISVPASGELREYVESLVERARICRNGADPRIDNMLKITGDGRRAALDMRLVDPGAVIHGETKVKSAIDNIFRLWDDTKEQRSTQLVFCDISTPNPDKFNVYHEIRKCLTEHGIPANEIAFIHDADTDAKKKKLYDDVNAGTIRIVFGSTEKLGAGTNIQQKLKYEHDLDAPWRPRDVEQRNGRILRPGNENEEVTIYRYVTQGSFDAYMWQTLETKARFIAQIMSGTVTVREAEDLEGGALSFAEIKAIASGNPAVMEKVKIDTEVRKLDILRASHHNQQFEIQMDINGLPQQIENSKKYETILQEDIKTRNEHEGDFKMAVGNRIFIEREEAGKALIDVVMSWKGDKSLKVRANYKGFEILSRANRFGEDYTPELYIRRKGSYEANLNPNNALGTIASIESNLRRLDKELENERETIERKEKALTDLKIQLGKPFEHEQRLNELFEEQKKINALLDLDKSDNQAIAEPEEKTGFVEKAEESRAAMQR